MELLHILSLLKRCYYSLMMFRKKRIYLDYAASTPIDPRVGRVVKKYQKVFANPSAIHAEGVLARKEIEGSRKNIARMARVKPEEVYFMSSGTESINLAIRGAVEKYGGKAHVITSKIEHPAVLEVCKSLESNGQAEITYLDVGEDGLVNPEDIESKLKENTVLVSIMQANNEIGSIQKISDISRVIKKFRGNRKYPYFHTDASQGALYLGFELESLGVDLLSIDGIKVYGPRGMGVLIKKNYVDLNPIILGGGQERGLRSGTENLPAIKGLEKALLIAQEERKEEFKRLKDLEAYFLNKIPNIKRNGNQKTKLPNIISLCLPGMDAEFLVIKLDHLGFAVSRGSACGNRSEGSSYVIKELGKKECESSSIRISLGRYTTKGDLHKLARVLHSELENT